MLKVLNNNPVFKTNINYQNDRDIWGRGWMRTDSGLDSGPSAFGGFNVDHNSARGTINTFSTITKIQDHFMAMMLWVQHFKIFKSFIARISILH